MTMPDTITLYQLPIEDAATEELSTYEVDITRPIDLVGRYQDEIQKVVTETIWHEFAHHFGMDEHEVREREEKRDDI